MAMLLTQSIQDLLQGPFIGVQIHPKHSNSEVITSADMMTARLDKDPGTAGVQEYYAWSALLDYFLNTSIFTGTPTIPADPYNFSTTANKRIIVTP
jgi:hypothetical protein